MCIASFLVCEDTKCSEIDERKRQLQGIESRAFNLSHQYVTTELDKPPTHRILYIQETEKKNVRKMYGWHARR